MPTNSSVAHQTTVPHVAQHNVWSLLKSMFFTSRDEITIDLELPRYEYMRIQTFIDDLIEITNGEIDFDFYDLTSILFHQFLTKIRTGKMKVATASEHLYALWKEYVKPEVVSTYKQVSENHWTLVEKEVPRHKRFLAIPVTFHRRSIVRGQVVLMDIARLKKHKEGFSIDVSKLISLLLMEFANELHKGNDAKLMKNIVKTMQEEEKNS